MILKRLYVFIWLLTLYVFFSNFGCFRSYNVAQKCVNQNSIVTYHFGFSIQPTINTTLITYAIVGERNGQVVYKQSLTLANFILQIKGSQKSIANPFKINYFEQYKLDTTFYHYILEKDIYGSLHNFCIDDIWMIRYGRNPLAGAEFETTGNVSKDGLKIDGWAAHSHRPNAAQMAILNNYGIIHFNHFVYGDNMFRLFYEMSISSWQEAYIAAGSMVSE